MKVNKNKLNNAKKNVLIVGGGTGGHVIPGLQIAQRLRNESFEVAWLGSKQGFEQNLVTAENISFHSIAISGLRKNGWLGWAMAPIKLLRALTQSIKIIRRIQPDLIIGMGGFVSGPGGLAAWLLQKPLVLHEQNAKPGLTNRVLQHLATSVCESFPDSFQVRNKVILTGNPVRKEICQILPLGCRTSQSGNKKILVLGGSKGAQPLNRLLPQALSRLKLDTQLEIWHQCGRNNQEVTENYYHDNGLVAGNKALTVKVDEFIKDMASAYQWADLVICRAGAMTVAEIACSGTPAIFIPYPFAVDNHQWHNANFLVQRQAGLILNQSENSEQLTEILHDLLSSGGEKLISMGAAAQRAAFFNAEDKILEVCRGVLR